MGVTSIIASTNTYRDQEAIALTQTKGQTRPITRSFTGISVSAFINPGMSQIEIYFDEPEGNAIVTIASMGQVINKYSGNTEDEWMIFMPIPAHEGEYCLTIRTDAAEYIGYFQL